MKYQKDYIYIKKMLTSISKVHEKFAFQEIRKKPTQRFMAFSYFSGLQGSRSFQERHAIARACVHIHTQKPLKV